MRKRSYRVELIILAITLGVILFMFLLNDINRQIRIKELKVSLQKISREENSLDHMGLVVKYRLHKRLYDNKITQDRADIIEMRVNTIMAEIGSARIVSVERYKFLSKPALSFINFFRMIIRKPPIQDIQDDMANVHLEVAYYYERNCHYNKALDIYDTAYREEKRDRSKTASILLHMGFCNAVLGNYKKAKTELRTVIDDYYDKPVAVTALILLRYIEGFRSEYERVTKFERDSVDKSEKLYRLIAYRDALNVIKRIEKKASPADKPRLLYLKARCLENMSQKEKAIDTFQRLIDENTQSKYAKLANRRIYISGAFANNSDKVKKLAINNNTVLNDNVFDMMLDEESRIRKGDGKPIKNEKLEREIKKYERQFPALIVEKISSCKTLIKHAFNNIASFKNRTEQKIKIQTNDGNVFVGVFKMETKDNVIIRSIFGDVRISKSAIKNRSIVK